MRSLFKTAKAPPADVATDAVALIERALRAQGRLWPDDRNDELIDVLLELRSTLRPPVTKESP